MATKYWRGGQGTDAQKGDFDYASNWWGAVAPVATDTIIFSDKADTATGSVTGHTDGNHWNCIDGLDAGVNFVKIIVTPEFTGDIGIGYSTYTGTESGLECGADEILCRGQGSYYFTSAAAGIFDKVVCDTASGAMYIGCMETTGLATALAINVQGSLEFLDVKSGSLAAPKLDALQSIGSAAITIVNGDNSGTTPALTVSAGTVYYNGPFTTAIVSGGSLVLGEAGFVPSSSETLGSLTVYGGAVIWRLESTLNGLIMWAGTVTADGPSDKTLGLTSVNGGTIEVHGGTLDLVSDQSGDIALGASCDVDVLAGGVFMPPVSLITAWT